MKYALRSYGITDYDEKVLHKFLGPPLSESFIKEFGVNILKHFNVYDCFRVVAGSEFDGRRSRKSEVIRYALDKLGTYEPSSTVMVGDRKHDVIGAKETGIDSIGVAYGYGGARELEKAGATLVVNSVEALYNTLI